MDWLHFEFLKMVEVDTVENEDIVKSQRKVTMKKFRKPHHMNTAITSTISLDSAVIWDVGCSQLRHWQVQSLLNEASF